MAILTIQLTEQQLGKLQDLSAVQNIPIEKLVNQIIDNWLNISKSPILDLEEKKKRLFSVAGKYGSGLRDVAAKHDKYLAEDFDR